MSEPDEFVCVGAIAGAFGVRGEVRVKSFTATPEDIFDYAPFTDDAGRVILTVASWRHVKDGFAAYCEEAASREDAMALRSTLLYAPRSRLPGLEEDEFYHADLIGMAVKGLDGASLGEVRAVQNFGAADLLEIWRTPGRKGAWYLPFTREAAPHVDVRAREITIAPPPDLTEDRDGETGLESEEKGDESA